MSKSFWAWQVFSGVVGGLAAVGAVVTWINFLDWWADRKYHAGH